MKKNRKPEKTIMLNLIDGYLNTRSLVLERCLQIQ